MNREQKTHFKKELMDLLIGRGKSGGGYVRFKLAMWEATLRLTYFVKRFFDIVFSIVMLVLLSPVFVITAVLIKLDSSGPVVFKQVRVGKNGRHFDFFKFRSMRTDAEKIKQELMNSNESNDGVIFKMKRDPRITRVGRFIRKFSIDELPQLFNVLIGDMSVVGPRPPIPGEVAQYTLDERKRLHIMPGITCIWQVSGRSNIPFKQQVELDKEYIKSRSFLKDMVILLKTIPAVFTGKGAY
ncbi:MAG: exopolysaccharide biosynthesis polyprenyl glycosylphosphotransferase [Victivallaceae bacterium]